MALTVIIGLSICFITVIDDYEGERPADVKENNASDEKNDEIKQPEKVNCTIRTASNSTSELRMNNVIIGKAALKRECSLQFNVCNFKIEYLWPSAYLNIISKNCLIAPRF